MQHGGFEHSGIDLLLDDLSGGFHAIWIGAVAFRRGEAGEQGHEGAAVHHFVAGFRKAARRCGTSENQAIKILHPPRALSASRSLLEVEGQPPPPPAPDEAQMAREKLESWFYSAWCVLAMACM